MTLSANETRDNHGRWNGGGKGIVGAIEDLVTKVFSEQQLIELKDYAEGNYQKLNGYLNQKAIGAFSGDPALAKAYEQQIKTIDAALKKSTLKTDITVYRGIQSPKLLANAEKLIGKEVYADSYQSTTRSLKVAKDFASFGKGAVVLEIKAKKGMHAINMERFKTSGNSGEQEVLFGHGHKFRITGVDRSQSPAVIKGEFV